MNTSIDYKDEKKGWVLLDAATDEWFYGGDGEGGIKTVDILTDAYFFSSREKAVHLAKTAPFSGRKWMAIPATVTYYIGFTRGKRVKGRRAE